MNKIIDLNKLPISPTEEVNALVALDIQGNVIIAQGAKDSITQEELDEALATKQDKLDDLDTIRAGAALGAKAIQDVKTLNTIAIEGTGDIAIKQDPTHTSYEVREARIEGDNVYISNEITDDRNYHSIGYIKEVVVDRTDKYITMSQDPIGTAHIDTDLKGYKEGDMVELLLSGFTTPTTLFTYRGHNVQRNDNGQVIGEGGYVEESLEYDPTTNTLIASTPAAIYYIIYRTDTNQLIMLGGVTRVNIDDLHLAEGAKLMWQPYVSPDYFWDVTITFQYGSVVATSSMPQEKNEYFRYENGVKAFILTDKNTTFKTINGETIIGNGDIEVDLSDYYTKEQTDALVNGVEVDLSDYYTKAQTDALLDSVEVDLSDYYTKTQTDALVNPKLEQVTLTQAEYDALTTKEDNVLYVISDAVILSEWVGTQEEYDALETKDNNTTYYITE